MFGALCISRHEKQFSGISRQQLLFDSHSKNLAQVPPDRFTGKPLIYRPRADGYLLYSVGVNGRDEQGRSYDDDPPGDDLVVRMPQPAPRNP